MRAAEIVDLNPAMTDAQQRPVAQAESSGGTVSLEALFAFKETVFRICLGHSRDYAEAEDLSPGGLSQSLSRPAGPEGTVPGQGMAFPHRQKRLP